MPIYAYRCANCGHAKDVLQRISDPLLTVCPVCGEPSFEKQVTAAGFRLKGSGWYVTDFRDEGKAPKNEHGAVNGHDAAADGAGASAHGESDKSGQAGKAGKADEGGGARESGKPAESSVSESAKSARSHDAAGPAAATAAASSSSSDSAPKQA